MPNKNPILITDEIYHIVIRGVADFPIFKDESDYYRALFSIYEFNTNEPVVIREKRENRKISRGLTSDNRKLLVEVLAFCFMPNHIHLLLRQIKENGISYFMKKFGTGYARYFNEKYNRKGHLFQGRFRAIHIKDDEQLKIVLTYIHANPISLIEPKWKEEGVGKPQQVSEFLENYRWSSYMDYLGKNNFPSVTNRNFLLEIMGGIDGCKGFLEDWIKYKNEINDFSELE